MAHHDHLEFGEQLLRATSLQTPILADNRAHYFFMFVPAMSAVGAKRLSSFVTSTGEIVDEYESVDGRKAFVGYKDAAISESDALYPALLEMLKKARANPAQASQAAILELMLGLPDKEIGARVSTATAPRSAQRRSSNMQDSGSDPWRALGWLVVIIVILVGVIGSNKDSTPNRILAPADRYASTPLRPRFTEDALPTPSHGTTWASEDLSRPAPLTIKTRPGRNYYIKLVSTSDTAVLYGFIHGGTTADLTAPLGSYHLRYAAGKTWYGRDHLFGPDTIYSEAVATFHFTEDPTGYSGYTVELILQENGNLSTRTIDSTEF